MSPQEEVLVTNPHAIDTAETYHPLEGHDEGQVCRCVVDHNPNPMELNRHHILPLGMGGADTPENLVWLCPTTHANVHELLRAWVRYEGCPPWEVRKRFGTYARTLAEQGYSRWLASRQLV